MKGSDELYILSTTEYDEDGFCYNCNVIMPDEETAIYYVTTLKQTSKAMYKQLFDMQHKNDSLRLLSKESSFVDNTILTIYTYKVEYVFF